MYSRVYDTMVFVLWSIVCWCCTGLVFWIVPCHGFVDSFYGSSTRTFRYRTYTEIVNTFRELGELYPNQTDVFSVQERYGVASPGNCEGSACEQIVMRISEKYAFDDESFYDRPEMFLSGEVHGNERVGPQAVTELAIYLLESYARETSGQALSNWATRMVRTRKLYIMPTGNALGYAMNTREENGIDPNRDFPYDHSGSNCMRTTAARAINEMYRSHLFQLALTFHSGMNAIAYEWGSFNHFNRVSASRGSSPESPDDRAQVQFGQSMRVYADHTNSIPLYDQGRMNDLVYPVHGGMEDWAYASSWDTSANVQCSPSTFGGYPPSKTSYGSSELRAFNILIETSDIKTPSASTLGDTSSNPLDAGGSGDGHVPRNMRLAALLLDVLQPYVNLQCPCASFVDDPGSLAPIDNATVTFQWEVGGAFHVDATDLWWGKWPTNSSDSIPSLHDWMLNVEAQGLVVGNTTIGGQMSGPTRWTAQTDGRAISSFMSTSFEPMFEHELSVADVWNGLVAAGLAHDNDTDAEVFIVARATVDASLAVQSNPEPAVTPQSHFVNARTNDAWFHENNGRRIQGHREWWSSPLRLRLQKPDPQDSQNESTTTTTTTTENPSGSTTTEGCLTQFGVLCSTPNPYAGAATTPTNGDGFEPSTSDDTLGRTITILGAVLLVLFIVASAFLYVRWRTTARYRPMGERNIDIELKEPSARSPDVPVRSGGGFGSGDSPFSLP